MSKGKLILIISFICLLGFAIAENEGEKLMETQKRLLATLEKFSEENDLSMKEVFQLIGDIAYNKRLSPKGGMGIITNDIFVILDSSDNRILYNNIKKEWGGFSREKEQVIVLSGGKIIDKNNMGGKLKNDLVIILFKPERIKFFDLSKGVGGYYLREKSE